MKNIFLLVSVLFISIAFSSCNKDEGKGGESTITGKIYLKTYDMDFKNLQSVKPAFDEDVYIMYGNNQNIDDKVVTGPDGTFTFDYLREGNYTIVYYTDDTSRISASKIPVVVKVSLGSGSKNLDTLYQYKALKIDDGTSSITGRIKLINWKNNFTEIKDTADAQEYDVYLKYEDHPAFDIRERTSYDGVYHFANLIKGKYTVFVYSVDISGATQMKVVKQLFEITEDNKNYEAPSVIFVNKD